MTKELHHAIMKRSRHRNKFLKDKSQTSKKKRNLRKKLWRKTKKSYFESLNTKKITDNRTFWQTVVPLFAKKASKGETIILNKVEKHVSDDKRICTIFNNFFSNVVSDLKIPNYCNYFPQKNTYSLSIITETFEKHPSILNIKKGNLTQYFHSERLLKRRYPGFKHYKNLSGE